MDSFDRKILAELQQNGRISLTELSDKIGISLSPCQRRLKLLEQNGVICDYQANVNPEKVGLHFSAIVFVEIREVTLPQLQAFENALHDIPQIIQAQRLFGKPDYMLQIVCENLAAFQTLYDKKLATLPNILRLSSTLVMKEIVAKRGLPLG
ncbi:AsnC family transcriptional regulator [Cricetibacter osteomyelitidis]|uniref:AsnC family transcriptional regulator n=1 Tax=Cricetibacter osteomyelitidis TaxID=1521931 RepID=A0A4R2T6P5_9PAST|nr:Lrp/AsnC family transcriptional regulator [Cricetibacter osteomyelitidis]TCP97311.1 AsnC family transcriptional regulator [Cricetibacter osteomyelitidis]